MKATVLALILLVSAHLAAVTPLPYVLDMVFHNPGESPFTTNFGKPDVLASLGAGGKIFSITESAVLGINWQSFDKHIFPDGSQERKWVDAKALELHKKYGEAKAAGLKVYCMSDLLMFPKRLYSLYNRSLLDITDSLTQELLRKEIQMTFEAFPELDGIVVRIGETYLVDIPYHYGGIINKVMPETVILLMKILREEVCVKLNKKVVFRTWMSFDTDLAKYYQISSAVEPHENLIISVKHCEGDFHRGNRFSKVLGVGQHKQIVEVQCAREYEGKGAFPNYIANGVINGFEEYSNTMSYLDNHSLKDLYLKTKQFAGIYTWSKGGGWGGPYVTNEFWNELNMWVLCKWGQNPSRSEEDIFRQYTTEVLGLQGESVDQFRKLALLSAKAVIRGHRTTFSDIDPWWTRDTYISEPPALPYDTLTLNRVLSQKREAVQLWRNIVSLSDSIVFANDSQKRFVRVSCLYGLFLHKIYQNAFELKSLTTNCILYKNRIDSLIFEYHQSWDSLRSLKTNNAECATIYTDLAFMNAEKNSVKSMVDKMENAASGRNGNYIKNLYSSSYSNNISLENNPVPGKRAYSDDSIVFKNVPEILNGAEYICWSNSFRNTKLFPLISFTVSKSGWVYILHDDNALSADWIRRSYNDTEQKCVINNNVFSVYSAEVNEGDLIQCQDNNMDWYSPRSYQYVVMFKPSGLRDAIPVKETTASATILSFINGISIQTPDQLHKQFEIYTLSGIKVRSGKLEQEKTVIPLERGLYIVRILKNDRLVETHKVRAY